MTTRFSSMLQKAVQGMYAVPAFNVYNLESFQAAISAAYKSCSPVILALGERYFANMRPGVARALVDALLLEQENPVLQIGLHLDHAMTPESCYEAIYSGFSSVMIDASSKSFEENVATTRMVVEEAHEHGVGVEAELGGLAVGEASHEFSIGKEVLTNPEQAQEFVQRTGVDALAVSVGTVHAHVPFFDRSGLHHSRSNRCVLHGLDPGVAYDAA